MTFTRTSSGLGNYPAFFKSELVVYVEGKSDGKDTFDEIYYENLIKRL